MCREAPRPGPGARPRPRWPAPAPAGPRSPAPPRPGLGGDSAGTARPLLKSARRAAGRAKGFPLPADRDLSELLLLLPSFRGIEAAHQEPKMPKPVSGPGSEPGRMRQVPFPRGVTCPRSWADLCRKIFVVLFLK